jgi:hypothetical protein
MDCFTSMDSILANGNVKEKIDLICMVKKTNFPAGMVIKMIKQINRIPVEQRDIGYYLCRLYLLLKSVGVESHGRELQLMIEKFEIIRMMDSIQTMGYGDGFFQMTLNPRFEKRELKTGNILEALGLPENLPRIRDWKVLFPVQLVEDSSATRRWLCIVARMESKNRVRVIALDRNSGELLRLTEKHNDEFITTNSPFAGLKVGNAISVLTRKVYHEKYGELYLVCPASLKVVGELSCERLTEIVTEFAMRNDTNDIYLNAMRLVELERELPIHRRIAELYRHPYAQEALLGIQNLHLVYLTGAMLNRHNGFWQCSTFVKSGTSTPYTPIVRDTEFIGPADETQNQRFVGVALMEVVPSFEPKRPLKIELLKLYGRVEIQKRSAEERHPWQAEMDQDILDGHESDADESWKRDTEVTEIALDRYLNFGFADIDDNGFNVMDDPKTDLDEIDLEQLDDFVAEVEQECEEEYQQEMQLIFEEEHFDEPEEPFIFQDDWERYSQVCRRMWR